MKKYILGALLISLLLLSGVAGCPTNTPTPAAKSSGLSVSFSKDAPPLSVNVNQEFPIFVDILNGGGDYIAKGDAKFYLTGSGQSFENVKSSLSNERVLNKESTSPDKLIFASNAKFTFPLQSLLVQTWALTSCYPYGTSSQANICIAASNQSSICSISGEKITSGFNSVAPVQISSLTEEVVGSRLRVSFTISNKLDGQVYLPDTDCDSLLQQKEYTEAAKKDKVGIEVRSPEKDFVCKLQGSTFPYISVDSLEGSAQLGTVICERPLSKEDHVSPFSVIMRYRYVSSITKNLNILP